MPYCSVCGTEIDASVRYCPACGNAVANIPASSVAQIPVEIRGWNWGAFLLTWIWGISHHVWISLLCFIPIVGIVMAFVLGAKGNEWAWRNGQWNSTEHFRRTQRAWAWWGLGVTLACIALYIALYVIITIASVGEPYY